MYQKACYSIRRDHYVIRNWQTSWKNPVVLIVINICTKFNFVAKAEEFTEWEPDPFPGNDRSKQHRLDGVKLAAVTPGQIGPDHSCPRMIRFLWHKIHSKPCLEFMFGILLTCEWPLSIPARCSRHEYLQGAVSNATNWLSSNDPPMVHGTMCLA